MDDAFIHAFLIFYCLKFKYPTSTIAVLISYKKMVVF